MRESKKQFNVIGSFCGVAANRRSRSPRSAISVDGGLRQRLRLRKTVSAAPEWTRVPRLTAATWTRAELGDVSKKA
uniref:Uncharacterized protein n=1 Tax=Steinernema glaseri TaxID=37863 RepID=A0A1I7YVY2_9BILA